MSIPQFSESTLRRNATAQSFERGEDYFQSGAVGHLQQRGNTIQAEVEGSQVEPYTVCLTFDEDGLTGADCTCPYGYEGWCKHIVATGLACLHQPESIEDRPTLEALLAGLDLPQARDLVRELVAEQPRLIEIVDEVVQRLAEPSPPPQTGAAPRRTSVDPAPYRRKVREILREAARSLEDGAEEDSIRDDLHDLIAKADDFTRRGDALNALVVLEAITRACADYWEEVADYGADSEGVAADLNEAWTEAILSTDLALAEKGALRKNLSAWEEQLGGSFEMSIEALRQGWDYLPLREVLQGQITELGAWEGEAPDYADDLAQIRLKILDRQQRYQEYLYLAQAEGQTEQQLTMLARLGRVDLVMEAAKTRLDSPETAFAVARVLREQGARAQALTVAQTGLNLPVEQPREQYELAVWASDLAESLGDGQAALATRITAFKAQPSLGEYQKALKLAGAGRAAVREELLGCLRRHKGWDSDTAKVDIFLQERLLDEAIATVKDLGYWQADLVKQVMAAAFRDRPDWVISNAARRAEEIMNAAKSSAYDHAVEWLKQARAAYLTSGRQADWQAYRNQLIERHSRKYKLVGMLRGRELA